MSILTEIPGLKEAVEKERLIRDLPLLGDLELICGVDVQPMTLRHFVTLDVLGSPIINDEPYDIDDLLLFLWVISPAYKPGARWRRMLWELRCRLKLRKRLWLDICSAVNAYVSDTWLDAPGHEETTSGGVPPCSVAGYMVHYFAWHYKGWTPDVVLNTPIKVLNQCQKLIRLWTDPEAHAFNRLSDKVKADWMVEQGRKNGAIR